MKKSKNGKSRYRELGALNNKIPSDRFVARVNPTDKDQVRMHGSSGQGRSGLAGLPQMQGTQVVMMWGCDWQ